MNLTKKLITLAVTLTLILGLASCGTSTSQASVGNGSATTTAPVTDSSGIVSGSVLNFRLPVDMEGLLPWVSPRATAMYCQVYDTLIQPYHGDWNDLQGLLATSWTTSDDGLTWVFQITDKAYFTNGNHLTAQTMVDCWAYTIQFQPTYFVGIDSIEATGEYELTFKLSAPNAALLANFANIYTGICDPSLVDEYGTESNDAAIGTGAYYLESYTEGSLTVLKANTEYWYTEETPSFETINYWYIPDNNTALAALKAGEIDVVDTNDYLTFETASEYTGMNSVTCYDQVRSFYMNANSSKLSDIRVRQALIYLIDREQLNLAQTDGFGTTTYSLWRTTSSTYEPYDGYEYNVDKGLALLEEAGVDPETLTLEFVNNTDVTGAAENIQAQLAKVGITLNVTTYDVVTSEAMIYAGNFDIGVVKVDMEVASPLNAIKTWYTSNSAKRIVWCDETIPEVQAQIDELADEAAVAGDEAEQISIIKNIHEVMMENALAIPGVGPCRWYIYNAEKIGNLTVDNGTLRVYMRWATLK